MLRKVVICIFWILANPDVSCQTSYNEVVSQGLRFQIQADSLLRLADAKTALLSTAPESEKRGIRLAISSYKMQSATFQNLADEQFKQAAALEAAKENNTAPEAEIIDADTATNEPETKIKPEPEFAILSKSPYSADNPIPIDEPLPDGVVYKIQLGAFAKALPVSTFKGLTPLSGEKLENGVTKYYAGLFRLYGDADDALRKVREYGFKDAYIIAFYNCKPVNPERAKQLE